MVGEFDVIDKDSKCFFFFSCIY